jgi:hypothetical protein
VHGHMGYCGFMTGPRAGHVSTSMSWWPAAVDRRRELVTFVWLPRSRRGVARVAGPRTRDYRLSRPVRPYRTSACPSADQDNDAFAGY